ncbi:receptor-like protein EIX2 isoform X3 [Cryptomeria japonica]|uniref:receptor-like protein EIX2 isoform X3 n=1 Tax=Cryptomeria japonica TaxID=3369 RepID=UPI0027DA8A29|nr:receptor-like protein EIX2 isoform X3 [Cryptomeria japonica]
MANLLVFTIITLFLLRFCCGCIEREAHALLLFKAGVNDSAGVLSSWEKERDCCLWYGISCDNTTHHVVAVNVTGFSLPTEMEGIISGSLCTLTFVATLNLSGLGLTDLGVLNLKLFSGAIRGQFMIVNTTMMMTPHVA